MGKLNKRQRREKRKKQKKEQRKRQRLQERQSKPWQPIKMGLFKLPTFIKPEATREERLNLVKSIGIKAKEDFNQIHKNIEERFLKYDPLYLLSFVACYFISHPEGTDPEVTGKNFFPHSSLELLQANALYFPRTLSMTPLTQEDYAKFEEETKKVAELIGLKLFDIPEKYKTEEELEAYRLRTEMMTNTATIRNWAYFHQMKKVVIDLGKLIDDDFKMIHGISASELMRLLFKLTDNRQNSFNTHRSKLRKVIRQQGYKAIISAYNEAFPENKQMSNEDADNLWEKLGKKKKHLIGMLIHHSDFKLEDVYSFKVDEALSLFGSSITREELIRVLDKLSYKFGDLDGIDKEHLIFTNPVHTRPFIKLDDNTYFSAIWGIFPHISIDILEKWVWENPDLLEKYTRLKSIYLENEIEAIFKKGFPNAEIKRGSIWRGSEGKEYENDLLILLEDFAIVVEAKSGSVSDPAKRGAPNRLFETLKALIEEPSEQALRFIDYLSANPGVHTLKTKNGAENKFDNSNIKYYIPLGVTFSHLGMIGSNLKKLIRAKVVDKKLEELAPSMSFTDLEMVFEFLPHEAEKIHYLSRRREFEAHVDYEGDELDLLAFYLSNGFNIGDDEYKQEISLNLAMSSKELDPYILAAQEGVSVEKPVLAMSKWWNDLLDFTDAGKIKGRIDAQFALLNTTKEDQLKFERELNKLKRQVIRGRLEKPHNFAVFLAGPDRRRYAIVGYPYTTTDIAIRNGVMNDILDNKDIKESRGAVVIGLNLNSSDYPYSVIASRMATNLFDTLTL